MKRPDGGVLQVLMFFPRGGSAQVVRYLDRGVRALGVPVRIVSGSLGGDDALGNARSFFGPGADVVPVPYDAAIEAPDPQRASPPLHPSYEDRPGAPDRVLAALDDVTAEHLVDEWTRILGAPGVLDGVAVAHLHHLTPAHAALARLRPDLPVITHIHGTEIAMIEAIERGADWPYAAEWTERLREWAHRSTRVIAPSAPAAADAARALRLDEVGVVPNGADLSVFTGVRRPPEERREILARRLRHAPPVTEGAAAGADGLSDELLAPLLDPDAVIACFVGRFTAIKRVPLLVRAHSRAREELGRPLPLVIIGGAPGEWEGEHPADVAARMPWGHEVFFAGWADHHGIAELLSCCDVMAAPSVGERFGQVYVEAMAMRMPVIGCTVDAPPTFIDADPSSPRRCGWLVPPDDEEALAAALVEAVTRHDERRVRGENGRALVEARFSWDRIARTMAGIYAEVAAAA